MENVRVKIKRLNGAKVPEYATDIEVGGNNGADLFSSVDGKIPVMRKLKVPTGIFVEIPVGVDMQIRSKSGIADKHSVIVLNTPGTVDPSYRGEVQVILFNLGDKPYEIKKGDKIAQAVFSPCLHAEFVEDEKELSQTIRGEGGFGHNGV